MFWWIVLAIGGFLILRSILRAFSAPRYYGGAPPAGTPPPGPGYGPGDGYGGIGNGGSFWSGLLGGLGGAWLGNELFREGGDGGGAPSGTDSAGWQSDAGQADPGDASSGDAGGGGGDSGGGW